MRLVILAPLGMPVALRKLVALVILVFLGKLGLLEILEVLSAVDVENKIFDLFLII